MEGHDDSVQPADGEGCNNRDERDKQRKPYDGERKPQRKRMIQNKALCPLLFSRKRSLREGRFCGGGGGGGTCE